MPPIFAPPGGIYTNTVAVELSSPSVAASMYYTLDGKEPTLTSPLYASPLIISNSTVIRARSFEQDLSPSPIAGQV